MVGRAKKNMRAQPKISMARKGGSPRKQSHHEKTLTNLSAEDAEDFFKKYFGQDEDDEDNEDDQPRHYKHYKN